MRAPSYKVGVTIVYIMGLFIQILDATIVNVALPTLAREFDVSVTDVGWVVVSYLLALASAIPAAGWLADRFGTKHVFLVALAVFTVASGLCGAAQSLDQLIAFRVLKGFGAGLITPVGSAILFRAYPMHERAKAATAVIGVAVIAPTLGPPLGGIIVDNLSWRWIFFVNVPIGIVAAVLGISWLRPDEDTRPSGRFDAGGLVLASGGLTALLYGLSVGPDRGWGSPVTTGSLVLAVVCFTMLVRLELRIAEPLLHLRLFSERLFRTTNLAGLAVYAGFIGQIFLFTLYLQDLRGVSATTAGITQMPQAFGVFVLSNVLGKRLYMKYGPQPLMVIGSAGAGLVTASVALTDTTTSLVLLGAIMFVRGLFMGLVFVAIQTAVYAKISHADTPHATSLFSAQRQSANAIGVAIAATVLAALRPDVGSDTLTAAAEGLSAYRWAFVATALMFVPGVLASSKIRNEDADATRLPVAAAAA